MHQHREEEQRFSFKSFFVPQWKDLIMKHRALIILLIFYFVLHLVNLTLLPVFNDESIYLDWAWSYTHMPGHLYDSLLDAKQPLMIWTFAFFENFFSDPLFAGRLAAVIIGAVTAAGIYTVTQRLLDKHIAVVATLLYSVTPIFVFYNRQALMEAGIACVGVWSIYMLLQVLDKPTTKNGIGLGIVLGIGFLIKSSSLLFVAAAVLIILFSLLKKKRIEFGKSFFFAVISFVVVNLILFINATFWQTFSTNSRYSYTLVEVFTFPFAAWFDHFLGFFEVGFVFITPLVFLFSVIGIFLMSREKNKKYHVFLAYFILALLLEIFSVKSQSQRYLVSFLPFLIIPAAYVIAPLWKRDLWKKSIVILSFLCPFILSLMIIFHPEYYIMQASKISGYSDVAHVRGQTSGYGIRETMQYIKEHSITGQPTLVLFGLNAGNPENGVDVYSQKDLQLYALHIDGRFFPGLEQYPCLISSYPTFFVTRNNELSGMDRYFSLAKSFPNPDGKYSIGIYTLKNDCTGKTASLSDIYQESMSRIWQLRSGYVPITSQ